MLLLTLKAMTFPTIYFLMVYRLTGCGAPFLLMCNTFGVIVLLHIGKPRTDAALPCVRSLVNSLHFLSTDIELSWNLGYGFWRKY